MEKYKCVYDYNFEDDEQIYSNVYGKIKTLEEWKEWLIKQESDATLDVFSAFDEDYIKTMQYVVALNEKDTLNRIANWDIKLEKVIGCAYVTLDINKTHKEIYIDLTSNKKDTYNALEKIKTDFSLKIDEIQKENQANNL